MVWYPSEKNLGRHPTGGQMWLLSSKVKKKKKNLNRGIESLERESRRGPLKDQPRTRSRIKGKKNESKKPAAISEPRNKEKKQGDCVPAERVEGKWKKVEKKGKRGSCYSSTGSGKPITPVIQTFREVEKKTRRCKPAR